MYFPETIGINLAAKSSNFNYLIVQIKTFVKYNWSLIFIIFSKIIFHTNFKLINRNNLIKLRTNQWRIWLRINFSYELISLFIVTIIIYISLGRHEGTFMTYFYQLMSPLLILYTIIYYPRKYINNFYFSIMILLNALFFMSSLTTPNLKNETEWTEIKAELQNSHGNVLASPPLTSLILEEKKTIFDSGQTEYGLIAKPVFDSRISSKITTYNQIFKDKISESLKKCEFSGLFITDPSPLLNKLNLSHENYYKTKEITLKMQHTNQSWLIEIWRPKCQFVTNN